MIQVYLSSLMLHGGFLKMSLAEEVECYQLSDGVSEVHVFTLNKKEWDFI